MKILVLGVAGMLGHKMFQTLRARFPTVYGLMRGRRTDAALRRVELLQDANIIEGIDALNYRALTAVLEELRPDVMINCIAVIKQRAEAMDAIQSISLNALLPHRLAATCAAWGGRLIHFSTDCVFNGQRGDYTEADIPNAQDLYGRTKHLGEVIADNALTLRTSIIGRELGTFTSLLEWLLSQNRGTVKGFKRAIYSGITSNHLAGLVGDLIERQPQLTGLYQVAADKISKYELLLLLRDAYRLDVEVLPDEAFHCDRSFSGAKFARDTGYVAPSWPELVAELANDPTPYQSWR
jgi:dTDP-4-dehydrorhamnose reductase